MGHPGAVIMEVHVLMIEETSYEKSDAQLNFTSYKCAVKSVITDFNHWNDLRKIIYIL